MLTKVVFAMIRQSWSLMNRRPPIKSAFSIFSISGWIWRSEHRTVWTDARRWVFCV